MKTHKQRNKMSANYFTSSHLTADTPIQTVFVVLKQGRQLTLTCSSISNCVNVTARQTSQNAAHAWRFTKYVCVVLTPNSEKWKTQGYPLVFQYFGFFLWESHFRFHALLSLTDMPTFSTTAICDVFTPRGHIWTVGSPTSGTWHHSHAVFGGNSHRMSI